MSQKPVRGTAKEPGETLYRLKAGAPEHYIGGQVTREWQGHLPVGVKPGKWLEEVPSAKPAAAPKA